MANMRFLVTSDESFTIREFYDAHACINGVDIYDENGNYLMTLYENEFDLNNYIADDDLYAENFDDINAYDEDAMIEDIIYFKKVLCVG